MNRRDLLKWFGAGAVAVPVIGGMPKPEAAAIILHQPVLDVPPPPRVYTGDAVRALSDAFMSREVLEVSVYIRKKNATHSVRINCEGYLSKFAIGQEVPIVDITSYGDRYRKFAPLTVTTSVQCTGQPEVVEGGLIA